jgi:protein ImuB
MALLPDRPPARFIWRRRSFQLAQAEGPERLEPGWWRPEEENEAGRDYWRVEDQDGRRFWLYRRIEAGAPRWFLHGLFA